MHNFIYLEVWVIISTSYFYYVLPLCIHVSVCQQNNSKNSQQILMKFLGGLKYVTSNKHSDFSGDVDNDKDTVIFTIAGIAFYKFCW